MRFLKILTLPLLGWYLLVPPWNHGKSNTLAPFNLWEQSGSFDTANECQDRKRGLYLANSADAPEDLSAAQHRRYGIRAQQLLDARCIEGDDPRLAK